MTMLPNQSPEPPLALAVPLVRSSCEMAVGRLVRPEMF